MYSKSRKAGSRLEFVRVSIDNNKKQTSVNPFFNQSSGVLSSITQSDGVIVQNIGQQIACGDTLQFIPFNE